MINLAVDGHLPLTGECLGFPQQQRLFVDVGKQSA
jgi:hypothetical protein